MASRMQLGALAAGGLLLVGGAAWWLRADPPATTSTQPRVEASRRDTEASVDAFFEIAVVTSLSEDELAPWAERAKLLELLPQILPAGDPRQDSPKAKLRDSIRTLLQDERSSSFESMPASRYLLPPVEDADQIAPELTGEERARFFASTSVLVVRLHGPGGPPHVVARAGFGLAAALAERLHGFIDDEVRRRIETPALVRSRQVLPEVPSAFADDAIALEFEPDEAGAVGRVLTLGMRRFGAPDLELREVPLAQAAAAAETLTAVARRISERGAPAELRLSGADLQRADSSATYTLRLVPAPMADGNPDNEMRTVQFEGGTARWLATVAQAAPESQSDEEFAARRRAVAAGLPALIARWKKEGGTLHVLADFAVADAGVDAGGVEAMWVEVSELSALELRGTLANEPAYAPALHLGDAVRLVSPVLTGARLELSGATSTLP